jgi:putative sigma-54 modulation protein
MNIIIKGTDLELTPSLKSYVESKFSPLSRFIKKFDLEGAAELRVEVARTTRHHKHGEVFRAEANLTLPGTMLRADESDSDARAAIDAVKNKLRIEIEKYKTKLSPRRPRK